MSKVKEISAREAAVRLGLRLDTLYAAIWAGKLQAHKLDGRWRIPLLAVEERLRAREAANGALGS